MKSLLFSFVFSFAFCFCLFSFVFVLLNFLFYFLGPRVALSLSGSGLAFLLRYCPNPDHKRECNLKGEGEWQRDPNRRRGGKQHHPRGEPHLRKEGIGRGWPFLLRLRGVALASWGRVWPSFLVLVLLLLFLGLR